MSALGRYQVSVLHDEGVSCLEEARGARACVNRRECDQQEVKTAKTS